MLDNIASMDQKDSIPRLWCAHRRLRQWHVQGWLYWLRCFRAVFSLIVGRPVLLGVMEFLDRVVRCPLRNDTPHGPDSADLRARAVLGQGGDSPVAPVEPPQVHFLDEVIVISTGALVQTVKTDWKFCSCCSSKVVDIPVFTQWLIPMVLFVQKTIEIPQFIEKVADFLVVRVVQILRCRYAEDIRVPTVAAR